MRPPIRETLASRAFDCKRRTFAIFDAERGAVVVAEIVFRKITMQMLLAAMLIHTTHAALEDAEIAFDRIGMDIAAHVFAM